MLLYEGKSLNKLRHEAQQLAVSKQLRMSLPKDPFEKAFSPGCGLLLIHGPLEAILPFMAELERVRPDVKLALTPAEPPTYMVRVLPTKLYSDPEQLRAHLAKEQALIAQLIDEKLVLTRGGDMLQAPPPRSPLASPERLTTHLPEPVYPRFPFAQRLRRRFARMAPSERQPVEHRDGN